MKPLKNYIKSLRDKRGWSQQHLADASGLSLRTIQRIEKKGRCSKESLLAVAAAFDVDIAQIGRPETYITSLSGTIAKILNVMKKYMNWLGAAYIFLLVLVIFILYSKYGTLYGLKRPVDYDEFNTFYVGYRNLLALSGISLTIFLATWASGYGFILNALWKGGLAFLFGIVLTGVAYSVLPWLLHPYDQYSPGAVYVFSSLIPGIICFICVSLLLYGIKRSEFLDT